MCTWICTGKPDINNNVRMNINKLVSDKDKVIKNGKLLVKKFLEVICPRIQYYNKLLAISYVYLYDGILNIRVNQRLAWR